jgi:hypothetical protein
MLRARLAALVAASVLLIAAPAASAADVILPFSNYKVGGSLTVKKLNQSIQLPPGSTFNGWANITQQTLIGNVDIPEFTSTVKVLGVPTKVTTKLEQVQPVKGTVTVDSNFNVHIRSTNSALLRIKQLRLGLLSVPTTCRTAEPLVLTLNYDGPLVYPLAFNGTTTIPRLTGCGLLGPTLGTLLSGPGNPYHITLAPPS